MHLSENVIYNVTESYRCVVAKFTGLTPRGKQVQNPVTLLLLLSLLYLWERNKIKFSTLVDGDLKAPLLIATTPRCRGGSYSIPWIVPLYP